MCSNRGRRNSTEIRVVVEKGGKGVIEFLTKRKKAMEYIEYSKKYLNPKQLSDWNCIELFKNLIFTLM